MDIRLATLVDYPAVEAIMQQVQGLHVKLRPDIYKPTDMVYSVEYFTKLVDTKSIVVATLNGRVCGLLSYVRRHIASDKQVPRNVLFVEDLAVDQKFRRQGVGTALLNHARAMVREEHLDGLELQVNARNEAARKMYEACGFTEKSINLEDLT